MKKIVEGSVETDGENLKSDSHIVNWYGVEGLCDDSLLFLQLSISVNVEHFWF